MYIMYIKSNHYDEYIVVIKFFHHPQISFLFKIPFNISEFFPLL